MRGEPHVYGTEHTGLGQYCWIRSMPRPALSQSPPPVAVPCRVIRCWVRDCPVGIAAQTLVYQPSTSNT